jgi:putative acyl-CoA dehydrogenase
VSYGLTAEPWTRPARSGAHLRRRLRRVVAGRGRSWLDLARGADRRLDAAIKSTVSGLQAAADPFDQSAAESGARAFAEQLATPLQAALLTRFAPPYLSDAFMASRLGGAHGHTFGTLPSDLLDTSAGKVIERSYAA